MGNRVLRSFQKLNMIFVINLIIVFYKKFMSWIFIIKDTRMLKIIDSIHLCTSKNGQITLLNKVFGFYNNRSK